MVGVQRFLLPEQPEVMAAASAAAEELRGRGVAVHVLVRRGDPALVLADVAAEENARLIVSQIVLDELSELKLAYPKTTAKRRRELKSIRRLLTK